MRTLKLIGLSLTLTLSGCGTGLCLNVMDCGLPAMISFSLNQALDLGARGFGTVTNTTVLMTNEGGVAATNLNAIDIPAPFGFAGGNYPGTGGTCTAELAAGDSCTLVISFTAPPPPRAAHKSTLIFAYNDGTEDQTVTLTLDAVSDNGPFNRAAGLSSAVSSLVVDSSGLYFAGGGTLNDQKLGAFNHFTPTGVLDRTFLTGYSSVRGIESGLNGSIYVSETHSPTESIVVGSTWTIKISRYLSDGTVDGTFSTGAGPTGGLNNNVRLMAFDGTSKIYIAGDFTTWDGTANIRSIARLNANGSLDTTFNIGTGVTAGLGSSYADSLVVAADGSGDVYVGGNFTAYRGTTNTNRIARINSDGTLDTVFNIGSGATAGCNGQVMVIAPLADGDVYLGGTFTSYKGTANLNRIVRVNTDGSVDTAFNIGSGASAGFNSIVYGIVPAANGDVYVAGDFTTYNGTTNVNHIVRLNSDGSIDTGFNTGSGATAGFNGYSVTSIRLAIDGSGDLYAGGSFTKYNNQHMTFLARLNDDGSLDTPFQWATGLPDWNFSHVAPATDGSGSIYVGGTIESVPVVARLKADGSNDSTFNYGSGFSSYVNALAAARDTSGDVYVGGSFTTYNGNSNINYITRLNSDGSIDAGFNIGSGASAGFGSSVEIIRVAADGDVYVGGSFTTYRGTTNVNRIARLNSDGSLDTGFNIGSGASAGFNTTVYGLALATDGTGDVYASGNFATYNGTAINKLVRLNSDGSLDTVFNTTGGFTLFPYHLAAAVDGSGDLYIGGMFTDYKGTANVNRIARLNNDGSLDTGFNIGSGATAGLDWSVDSLYCPEDGTGAVFAGGTFWNYNGTQSNQAARIKPNGALDTDFNTGTGMSGGFSGNCGIYGIASAVDGSGDTYFAGCQAYKGVTQGTISRISSTGVAD